MNNYVSAIIGAKSSIHKSCYRILNILIIKSQEVQLSFGTKPVEMLDKANLNCGCTIYIVQCTTTVVPCLYTLAELDILVNVAVAKVQRCLKSLHAGGASGCIGQQH